MKKEPSEEVKGKRSQQEQVKIDAILFYGILVISFILILVLNFLTPLLSDDYAYLMEVEEADSIWDLFGQEYHQYMTWSGRSIAHFVLRVFLFLPTWIFKIANSFAFIAVGVLMAKLVHEEKKDWFTLLLCELSLWLFSVDFSETVLWEDGACNYLWCAMFILLFMLLEKRVYTGKISSGKGGKGIFVTIGFAALGLLAGWCNENTSGGCLLFIVILLIARKMEKKKIPAPLISGLIGNAAGLMIMVLSPGEWLRASYSSDEESYTGILRLLSRFQKITLNIEEYFGILLAVLLVFLVVLVFQKNLKGMRQPLVFTFLFAATSYALILSRPTQARALFGAGIFLCIAVIGAIDSAVEWEKENPKSGTGILLRIAAYSGMAVGVLTLFFDYADNGTNLARVYRDENTRISYIEEQAAKGEQEIVVPLVHTDFYNDYSAIEKMEMTNEAGYWINVFYEEYYGVESIVAIDYDAWEEKVGLDDAE